MSLREFFDRYADRARSLENATGVSASVILAQMAHESNYGRSAVAGNNNLAGIKYVNQQHATGEKNGHAAYETLDDFFADYQRVLSLDYLRPVRQETDPEIEIRLFCRSAYATDPDYGDKVLRLWKQWDLGEYDGSRTQQEQMEVPGGKVSVDDRTAKLTAEKSEWLPWVMLAAFLMGVIND